MRATANLLTPHDTALPHPATPRDPMRVPHILDVVGSSFGGVADVEV